MACDLSEYFVQLSFEEAPSQHPSGLLTAFCRKYLQGPGCFLGQQEAESQAEARGVVALAWFS